MRSFNGLHDLTNYCFDTISLQIFPDQTCHPHSTSMFSFTSLHIPSPKLYCHTFLIFNIHLLECRFLWIGTLFYLMVYPHHVLIISGFFFNLSFIVGNDVYILITGAVRFAFKPESLNVVAKGNYVT